MGLDFSLTVISFVSLVPFAVNSNLSHHPLPNHPLPQVWALKYDGTRAVKIPPKQIADGFFFAAQAVSSRQSELHKKGLAGDRGFQPHPVYCLLIRLRDKVGFSYNL